MTLGARKSEIQGEGSENEIAKEELSKTKNKACEIDSN